MQKFLYSQPGNGNGNGKSNGNGNGNGKADTAYAEQHTAPATRQHPHTHPSVDPFWQKAAVFEHVHASIIVMDMEGVVILWNQGAEHMFGYTANEMLGRPISTVFPLEEHMFLNEAVLLPLKQRGLHTVDVRMRCKSGADFYAHLSLSLLYDETQTPIAMIGSFIDITQHKNQEQRLHMFQALAQNTPDAVWIADLDGVLTYLNPAYQQIAGYDNSAIGSNLTSLYQADPDYLRTILQHVATYNAWQGVLTARRRNGSTFEGQLSILAIRDEQGQLQQVAGVVRDVTERLRAEAALRQAHTALERRLQERTSEIDRTNKVLQAKIHDLKRTQDDLRKNELRHRALISAIPDALFVLDRSGTYLDYHTPHGNTLALPASLVGSRLHEVFPPELADRFLHTIETALTTGIPQPLAYAATMYYKPVFYEARIVPVHTDTVMVLVRDMTDQKRAETDRERFFELSLDLMTILDTAGVIQHYNPAWLHVLAYSADELHQHRLIDLLHPDDRAASQQALDHLVAGEQIMPFETRLRSKHGTYRYFLWSATYDPHSRLLHMVARDITERKQTENQLILLGQAVEHTTDSVLITDANLQETGPQIVFVNPAFCAMTGYQPDEIIGKTPRILQGPETDWMVLKRLKQALEAGEIFEAETVNYRKDGSTYHVEWRINPIRDGNGTITHFVSVQRDVTQRTYARRLERDQRTILELMVRGATLEQVLLRLVHLLENQRPTMQAAIQILHQGRVVYRTSSKLPSSYWHLFDEHLHDIVERRADEQVTPCATAVARNEMIILADETRLDHWPAWKRVANEHNIHACWIVPITNGSGKALGTIALYSPQPVAPASSDYVLLETVRQLAMLAVEQRSLHEQIVHQAYHDDLTGLPNRVRFLEKLRQVLNDAAQYGTLTGLIMIDLDRFKQINDTLGHPVGDQLLIQTAHRFQQQFDESVMLARMSGDEFALLLPQLPNVQQAVRVGQHLLETLKEPFVINGRELVITASIGISFSPQDGDDSTTLLRYADHALYRAKSNGANQVMCFTPEMTNLALERLEMEHQLHRAFQQGELMMHYQPLYDIQSETLVGLEALIRWQHPRRGLLSAGRFIHLLEESGLVFPVGLWTLREVCRQVVAWQQAGYTPVPVAVNISAQQLTQPDFVGYLHSVLHETGCAPDLLHIEMTESTLLHDHEPGAQRLEQIRSLGVRVAIDDFGTGYSSLAYLQQLPVDSLKIDRSFVRSLGGEAECTPGVLALINTIITLAHNFHLRVVAEGIETAQQLDVLRQMGCEVGQGFLLGKPAAPDAIAQLLV